MVKELYGGRKRSGKKIYRSRRRKRTRTKNKVGGGGLMIIRSKSFRSPSKNPMVCRKEKKMLGKDMFYDSEDCSNMMNIHPHHFHKRGSKKKHKKKGKHSRRRKPKIIVMGSRCGNCGLQHGGAPCGMKGGFHHSQRGG